VTVGGSVPRWSLSTGPSHQRGTQRPTVQARRSRWPIDVADSTLKAEPVRRGLGWIVAGCVVVGVLASCSKKKPEGAANTAPIATEAIVSTLPPAPPTTQPAPTTTEPGSPLLASEIPPVPILVRYQPKNKGEEELLAAAQDLLPKLHALNHDSRFVEAEYLEAFTSKAAEVAVQGQRKFAAEGFDSLPGGDDRIVVESVERTSTNEGVIRSCDYDTSTTFKRNDAGLRTVDNDEKTSFRYRILLEKTPGGWRVAGDEATEVFPGEDKCAS
jgi:hypothetical protein